MKPVQEQRIDCDVHAVVPGIEALLPFLPAYWRQQAEETGFRGPQERWCPLKAISRAPGLAEEEPATHVGCVQRDVLCAGTPAAVVVCDYAVDTLHNPDAASAFMGAVNEWLAADWLSREPRLRASICVAPQFPDLAAEEIARRAADKRFVQVLLPVRSEAPYGSRRFRPIFEAAARAGLPVCVHAGGAPGNASTPVGWTSFHSEDYVGASSVFQTQLMSIIASGLFDSHPGMRLVLAESGVTWLPTMLWRFDKNWKGLRREVPWLRRPPSEYVREHVLLTTAPFDAPLGPDALAEVVGQLGGGELLLYSSDYPHFHGEDPAVHSLAFLAGADAARALGGNARRLYGI